MYSRAKPEELVVKLLDIDWLESEGMNAREALKEATKRDLNTKEGRSAVRLVFLRMAHTSSHSNLEQLKELYSDSREPTR